MPPHPTLFTVPPHPPDSPQDSGAVKPIVGARCVSYDFEDLLLSAALMQQTDVLIGVHGETFPVLGG